MATVVIQDDHVKVTTVCPGGEKIGITVLARSNFFERLFRYAATVTLKEVTFEQDIKNPLLYKYVVEQKDGRTWKQEILISSGSESEHSFDIGPQKWKKSEFISGRDLRDTLEDLARNHGLNRLVCQW